MRKHIDKLIQVISNEADVPFGTILSVTREHRSKEHWIATEAETNKPYILHKKDVKEV